MRRYIYRLSLMMVLLPGVLNAQERAETGMNAPTAPDPSLQNNGAAMPLSLEDAIQYALKHQAKMKNAYLDQKTTLAKNREVTGMALPKISAGGGINYAPLVAAFEVPNFIKDVIGYSVDSSALTPGFNSQSSTIPLAFQPKWTTTATADVSQLLFEPSIMVALQARKKLEALAQKNIELTQQDLKVAVTKAYYNVLIAQERFELLEQNIKRIAEMHRETSEIYKNGLAEKLDVDRLTVTLNNLKTEEIKIKRLLEVTYMALKFQMGMDLQEPIKLTDSLEETALPKNMLAETFDINNRTEYQLLKTQGELLEYDVKRYKLGWLPTLSLFGNYGYTLYNSDKLFSSNDKWQKSALIGTKLSIPIFSGFQRTEKLKQARYALEKNDNDRENLEYALELEKESARISFQSNLAALNNQKANMELAESIYNTAQIKYKEGVGSSLEVMNAESSLKEAQTNYFGALYDVITARVDYAKAMGLLK